MQEITYLKLKNVQNKVTPLGNRSTTSKLTRARLGCTDLCFTDNSTVLLICSPREQCWQVFCMRSPTSFSRALLWKNNEILWMSSDFSHCLETQTHTFTQYRTGCVTVWMSENSAVSLQQLWEFNMIFFI